MGDGPDRARLQAIAGKVLPRSRIPRCKTRAGTGTLFAAADLFVLPGTGGLAVQQAMAHALPVMVGEADGTQANWSVLKMAGCSPSPTVDDLTAAFNFRIDPMFPACAAWGMESFRIVTEESQSGKDGGFIFTCDREVIKG